MITVEHLTKRYGSTLAVNDLNFTVAAGEILGFLGPNGAGKTTTMRMLTGYMPPSGGTATIAGFDVLEDSLAVRQRIGYLPETPPLYREMTVQGYLHFVASIKGVSAGERSPRVDWAMGRCGLSERRHQLIRKLSKGFRQRVGIAQAIVHDPPVIILDEPTVGLDPKQIIEVRNLIKSLAGDHTIILSTHILPEVSMTCNRVVIIQKGQVVATDTIDRLVSQSDNRTQYELKLTGNLEPLQTALGQFPGVDAVQTQSDGDNHVVTVTTAGETDVGPELTALVVQAGLKLYEMNRRRATLEDVFLQLTTTEVTSEDEAFAPETEADS
ncbi:ATP-binding protein of ABC transporter [Gloeomargarita lithophora Alchichica-D10]|uniref:ATP-binding protein of ABC transporter n=1 Tax=Gloeomargarita lithophora Alchichica-D10 TaxID=1188229 RepID=A0A1J0ACE4_9CYAN|nr:ATP-binding cassette domain-containing protein [Gloeomargarita lithophora]APB33593.1 ATP-binding protein of ABC transporter [Gloeomargarita lithophora Alchichica-D10]